MKKFSLVFGFVFFFLTSAVQAETIKVIALDKFSAENPTSVYNVKTIDTIILGKTGIIYPETVISGHVIRVEHPKIGKRNGYFEFVPETVTYKGNTEPIKNYKLTAKIIGYNPVEFQKLAFTAARKAANFFLKGAISAAQFVQGALQAEKGQRIKTGILNVYKDSFFVYIETGKELNANPGDMLIMKLKITR